MAEFPGLQTLAGSPVGKVSFAGSSSATERASADAQRHQPACGHLSTKSSPINQSRASGERLDESGGLTFSLESTTTMLGKATPLMSELSSADWRKVATPEAPRASATSPNPRPRLLGDVPLDPRPSGPHAVGRPSRPWAPLGRRLHLRDSGHAKRRTRSSGPWSNITWATEANRLPIALSTQLVGPLIFLGSIRPANCQPDESAIRWQTQQSRIGDGVRLWDGRFAGRARYFGPRADEFSAREPSILP